jgi:putative FmdB family regulatory protein
MPTYDYECDACGHSFELFQSISEPVKKKCPECGKSKLRRLFGTGAAVMFKGSGFYQTDYRSESYKKAAEMYKPASDSKGDKKSESTSASKPDTKGDSKPSSEAKTPSSGDKGKKRKARTSD